MSTESKQTTGTTAQGVGKGSATATTNPPAAPLPAVLAKSIADDVLAKVVELEKAGGIDLPKNYSASNALKMAQLILPEVEDRNGNKALEVCTRASIAQALFKMVTYGLNVGKGQCALIVYGKELQLSIEYPGKILMAKRADPSLVDVKGFAVFAKDEFEFELDMDTMRTKVLKHKSSIENMSEKEFRGGYAVAYYADGTKEVEVMSMQQIRDAWNQGAMKGNSPAHRNFPDQMIAKTCVSRLCKFIINQSDDSSLHIKDEDSFDDIPDKTAQAAATAEVADMANTGPTINIDNIQKTKEVIDKEGGKGSESKSGLFPAEGESKAGF